MTVPAAVTIPVRTPFTLTGSATDPQGDALTYLWEQNDPGAAALGTPLTSNAKLTGPLFRVFGTKAEVSDDDTILSPSPGENVVGTVATRDFPDLGQVLKDQTNAASGTCPGAGETAASLDCFSEFLPTALYAGPMHFRLTARDGNVLGGGVAHADTTVSLAPAAGPFRTLTPAAGVTLPGGATAPVTWDPANTAAAPVGTANVRISLSTDGGRTFPTVLVDATPNDGAADVPLPNLATTTARLKIEAVGNVFYDVSHADFAITRSAVPDPTPTTPTTPAAPTTPTAPTTPAAPAAPSSPGGAPTSPGTSPSPTAVSRLAPTLRSVARRLRISRTGRVSVVLRCRTVGEGTAPRTCTGTLRITARVRGKVRTVGTARFSFARTSSRTVGVRLTSLARRSLRTSTAATIVVRVTGGRPSLATKRVRLVPVRR